MQTRREFTRAVGLGAIGLSLAPSVIYARPAQAQPFPRSRTPSTATGRRRRCAKRSGSAARYADIRFTLNRSNGIAVRNGRLTDVGQHRLRPVWRRGHLRVWRARHSQRRLGLFEQSQSSRPRRSSASSASRPTSRRPARCRRSSTCASRRSRRTTRSGRRRSRPIRGTSRSRTRSRCSIDTTVRMQKNPDVRSPTPRPISTTSGSSWRRREGSFIEQVFYYTACSMSATARKDGVVKTRTYNPGTQTQGLGVRHRQATCRETPSAWRPRRSSTRWPSRSAAG